MLVEALPCTCGRPAVVTAHEGGTARSGATQYGVYCACGVKEEFLGKNTGRRSVAVSEWNQIITKLRASQGECGE